MMMQREGMSRPLEPAEFSDGTLRFMPGGGAVKPAPSRIYRPQRTGKQPASADAARPASLIAEASRYSQIWLTSHSPELAHLIEKHRSFSLYQLSMAEGRHGWSGWGNALLLCCHHFQGRHQRRR